MIPAFEKYLDKHPQFVEPISITPNNKLNNLIIIPVYNEPKLINTLQSLKNCKPANKSTEVIIVINHSADTKKEIIKQNNISFEETKAWSNENKSDKITFHTLLIPNMPKKFAGVGLARKIGMDEAVRRLSKINNENGIIISLDADTLVSKNYLQDIENEFTENKKLNTVLPWFEHEINTETKEIEKAIIQYELYLRYFKLALKYSGFPYAFHTIGSAFAVKALAYVKQGGMNKKQGGEDFYFLQKVFSLGHIKELNHVKVFPSARASNRVPFGTGPAVQKIINDGEFLTYKPEYFSHLKELFSKIESVHNKGNSEIEYLYNNLDNSIQKFIPFIEFKNKINEINNNSSSINAFVNRFFQWFDAFKIIKYINTNHNETNRVSVLVATKSFLKIINEKPFNEVNPIDLLNKLRQLEISNRFF